MAKLKLAISKKETSCQAEKTVGGYISDMSPETLEAIFRETLDDLNKRTLEGLLGEEADPNKLEAEGQAKNRLDATWQACLRGKATLEAFREAVKEWHEAIIKLFTQRPKAWQERLF